MHLYSGLQLLQNKIRWEKVLLILTLLMMLVISIGCSNDELENLKSGYAKYYNSKVNESRLKYKTIRENYEKKKEILSQRVGKRESRENTINLLNQKLYKDLKMEEKTTHAKIQKRIDIIYTILLKSGYTNVNHYINSDSDKELVF